LFVKKEFVLNLTVVLLADFHIAGKSPKKLRMPIKR